MISPFTPLFFGARRSDGLASRYVQTFAPSDQILLEVFGGPSEEVSVTLNDELAGSGYAIACGEFSVNAATRLSFATLSGLYPGEYTVTVNGARSRRFRVTDSEAELSRTTLIQYSNKDNRRRTDALFIIDGMRYFFDLRVPGGFKDSGWSFAVDNEQFTTSDGDPVELYALETTQKKFTLGCGDGVDVETAELLNRLLTCNYVYFDGVRHARKGSSVPEMSVQVEGLDSFVFTQQVQRVCNLDPLIENGNRLVMRRLGGDVYRASDGTNINRINI